jgi:hypothetical protein
MDDFEQLFKSVRSLVEQVSELHQQAVKQYGTVVDNIIRARNRDVSHIEHTLDGLLDFCGYDPAFQLFRRLCRYYWGIDPNATASYINSYRELWDS